jgi:hypothetical protein
MSDEQEFQHAAKAAMDAIAKGQDPGDVLASAARARGGATAPAADAPSTEGATQAGSGAAAGAGAGAGGAAGAGSHTAGGADAQPGTAESPRALPINWDTEPTPAYVNGVQVMHTAQDFALLYTEMRNFPGRHSATQQAGDERASIAASLRMNPDVYFQMLCILTSNWNRYVAEYVDPRMRQPRFKLLDAGDLQLDGIKKSADE